MNLVVKIMPPGYFTVILLENWPWGSKYWLSFLTINLFVTGQLGQENLKTACWEMPLKSQLPFLNSIIKEWPMHVLQQEKVTLALSLSG